MLIQLTFFAGKINTNPIYPSTIVDTEYFNIFDQIARTMVYLPSDSKKINSNIKNCFVINLVEGIHFKKGHCKWKDLGDFDSTTNTTNTTTKNNGTLPVNESNYYLFNAILNAISHCVGNKIQNTKQQQQQQQQKIHETTAPNLFFLLIPSPPFFSLEA